ncbi:HlyD family secretion protein [Desulfoscipio gibsoniae]|uniref:Multidrug resistance efflux pump n=1 Tax=Desulfoscipio gibsoniae DSM 7213 TaxID=767817 RepID=R4KRC6_9FIRM|nr:efflux RND transporter periplasmic adaptor subunit [Desulfoscipio gibsoniae]AGL02166.1 multidrug resistance efflux pump [Desulfoscipio gibsoniae DSM 7213]
MEALNKIDFKKVMVFILFMSIICIGILIFYRYFYLQKVILDNERQSLTATGTIEATTVLASFKIPGKLKNVLVDEGIKVEIEQEIASLEDQEISSDLVAAQGAYDAAVAQAQQASESVSLTSEQVESTINQLQAKLAQAEIGVKDAKLSYDRALSLFQSGAVPQKTLDDATSAYNLAQSKLHEARAGLEQALANKLNVSVAQSQYQAAQGSVKQASGAVQKAEAYLKNTHLLSPISGYITKKYLQPGEMLNAGTPVYEITDLVHTYVNIYISEKKIGRVHLNQEAEITVDAFPDRVFKGKVVLINDAGEFAVQKAIDDQYEHDIRSFRVKIDVPNDDLALKTGMTARVRIIEGGQ